MSLSLNESQCNVLKSAHRNRLDMKSDRSDEGNRLIGFWNKSNRSAHRASVRKESLSMWLKSFSIGLNEEIKIKTRIFSLAMRDIHAILAPKLVNPLWRWMTNIHSIKIRIILNKFIKMKIQLIVNIYKYICIRLNTTTIHVYNEHNTYVHRTWSFFSISIDTNAYETENIKKTPHTWALRWMNCYTNLELNSRSAS